ncbi:MAG: ADP-forming succinate--CoA ligase subunit beta [Lentimicrobiaceae bacterium]|nr:ADP-forming succinate--CoA ligase subunit beta [Lentimicrobiaceae bacterium]
MNLHEYQAKQILKSFGVTVPEGMVAETPEKAVKAAEVIQLLTDSDRWAIKAQIHAGGRGKGGGVKIAKSLEDVREKANQIIGMHLVTPQTSTEGKLVNQVLVEQNIYYPGEFETQEFYLSILLNRNTNKTMIMYSPEGGMDIEEVAEKRPDRIFIEEIERCVGLQEYQCRKIACNLQLTGKAYTKMLRFIRALYNAYRNSDATLLEINPMVKTSDNNIIAADAKIRLDNNALFRHPEYASMRDIREEDIIEVEATQNHLNYVKLNGNVGCMVNGAGLAMATMDIIKLYGGEPANFLDVGGTANAARVEQAFRIILKDPNVKVILVNIFGGIVRCDRVAQGIIDAYKNIGDIKIPIIVRLQGTNAVEARQLIEQSDLKVFSATLLQEAAEMVTRALT